MSAGMSAGMSGVRRGFVVRTRVRGCGRGGRRTPGSAWVPRAGIRAGVAGVAAGLAVGMMGAPAPPPAALAFTEEQQLFLEAWRDVNQSYVDGRFGGRNWYQVRQKLLAKPLENREATYARIRELLALLDDRFTRLLTPAQYSNLVASSQGDVVGVGVELDYGAGGRDGPRGDGLRVVSPAEGGPAARAGVLPGDVLLAIDGVPTRDMELNEAAVRLRGAVGEPVELLLRSGGGSAAQQAEERTLTVARERIELRPVYAEACAAVPASAAPGGKPVGYLRVSAFNEKTVDAVGEAVRELLGKRGAGSLVLDLRNNAGGRFPAGIAVANMFLDSGGDTVITYITDAYGDKDLYQAEGETLAGKDVPMAVLVNKGTASAAEVLAGALRDNRRAEIIGERTYGKGLIQTVFKLSDGSGLVVTVAKYQTPGRNDINGVGITPTSIRDVEDPARMPPLEPRDVCAALADTDYKLFRSSAL